LIQVNARRGRRKDAYQAENRPLAEAAPMSSKIVRPFALPLRGIMLPRVAAVARVIWLSGLTLAVLLLTSIDESYACIGHHGGVMHIASTHRPTPPSASSAAGMVVTSHIDCAAGTCSHSHACWYCACCATYSVAVTPKSTAEFVPELRSTYAAFSQSDVVSFAASPEIPPPIPFA
jgi:hypothetical protein